MIIGNAITFSETGFAYTQNALFPSTSKGAGLAGNFVQRSILEKAVSPVPAERRDDLAAGFADLHPKLQHAVNQLTAKGQVLPTVAVLLSACSHTC
jgi:hypothetical protein